MANYSLTQTGAKIQADLDLTEHIQDEFSTSSTYAVGALVIYNTKIYRCHTAVSSAGAWTGSTNWTEQKLSDLLNLKQNTLTFDSAPTSASTNPVTSGGVYTALTNKQASSSVLTSISGQSSGTGLLKLTNGTASLDSNSYLTSHLYRPISLNGSSILANTSSTALNLVPGTNVTMTNSSGSVTINATDTTYTAGTGLNLSSGAFSVDSSVVALQSDLPSGELDVTLNGTATATTEVLNNIVAGTKTYTLTSTRGTAASGGTTLSLVNTGDMYTWNNKQSALTTSSVSSGTINQAVGFDSQGNLVRGTLSQGITFVEVVSGYSGNIVATRDSYSFTQYTKIKFETAPTSDSDYDSAVDYNGNIIGLTSYSNKTKIYIWGSEEILTEPVPNNQVTINNVTTTGGLSYDTAVELTLTGNYDIELAYGSAGGGN